MTSFVCCVTLALSPKHHGIDECLGLRTGNVTECHNLLVECRVNAWAAYLFNVWLGVERHGDTFVQFLFSLGNKLVLVSDAPYSDGTTCTDRSEQDVQCVLPNSLLFIFVVS